MLIKSLKPFILARNGGLLFSQDFAIDVNYFTLKNALYFIFIHKGMFIFYYTNFRGSRIPPPPKTTLKQAKKNKNLFTLSHWSDSPIWTNFGGEKF